VSKGGQGKGKRFRRDRGGKNRGPANWVKSDNDGLCFNCGGDHLARYCNRGGGEGGKGHGFCFNCRGDRYASKCPNGSGGSGGRDYGGVCGKYGGGSGCNSSHSRNSCNSSPVPAVGVTTPEKGKRRDRGKKNRGIRGGEKNRAKEKAWRGNRQERRQRARKKKMNEEVKETKKENGGGGGYGGCQCSLFRGCTYSPEAGSLYCLFCADTYVRAGQQHTCSCPCRGCDPSDDDGWSSSSSSSSSPSSAVYASDDDAYWRLVDERRQ
jgi:hypothetical protein